MRSPLFVDLTNFYSSLIRCGVAPERELRDYFLDWLRFDVLGDWLSGSESPVWVFHSGRRFGSGSQRVEGGPLENYIKRINRLPGVTAFDVEIPGEQREPYFVECPHCHKTSKAQMTSEKGIDASLIVHLFDTFGSWDTAFLLAGDADYTPAVRSLRRAGKRVSGAGFAAASEVLVRELFGYVDLTDTFIREDFSAYQLFGAGKLVELWLNGPIPILACNQSVLFSFGVEWKRPTHDPDYVRIRDGLTNRTDHPWIRFSGQSRDPDGRDAKIADFRNAFPTLYTMTKGQHTFYIPPIAWPAVKDRLVELARANSGTCNGDEGIIEVAYGYDRETDEISRRFA